MAKRNSNVSVGVDAESIIVSGDAGNIANASDTATDTPGVGDTIILDPSAVFGSDTGSGGNVGGDTGGDNPVRRKRGRPRGSGGTSKRAAPETSSVSVDSDIVTSILFSLHTVASVVAKTPELAVDETEAKQMSDALAKVSEHYDVQASAKSLAWGNLVLILAMIYGTRFVAIRNRWIEEKKTRQPDASDENVISIPGVTRPGNQGMFQQ